MTAPLLSADELSALVESPPDGGVVILDATTHLDTTVDGAPYTVRPDRGGFRDGHVPGARFADVTSLSDPDGGFAFTLPSADAFAAAAGALGIGDDTHVVVYDRTTTAWATRVWWLLRVFGHDGVSLLDGGLRAWRKSGRPVETGQPAAPAVATFTPRFRPGLVTDADEVSLMSGGAGTLVNALDAASFRGESEVNPYSRRGRIPGSTSLPRTSLVDPGTGRLYDRNTLARLLRDAGLLDADRAVTYCGGGIAATLPAFAAYLVAGAEIAVYDGSLSEWTADPDRPVEVG